MVTAKPHVRGKETESRTTSASLDTDRSRAPRCEEVYVRNFDMDRTYEVTVTIKNSDGVTFTNRYYLTPGKTVSVLGQLPPGEYEVQAVLDGRRQQSTRCEIGDAPERTALIEVGNGTISVTEGLYRGSV
jgi:hypothetical protein